MFHKKSKKTPSVTPTVAAPLPRVQTIPSAFYGGLDPVIYQPSSKGSSVSEEKIPLKDKKVEPAPPRNSSRSGMTAVPTTSQTPGVSGAKNKSKKMFILLTIFFLVAVGGISFYYLVLNKSAVQLPTPPTPPVPPPTFTPATSSVPIFTPTSTLPQVSTSTIATSTSIVPFVNFPSLFLVTGGDLDQDTLTDVEEEIYRTDSGTFDTDSDGYFDGQEVVNLYNPAGTAPEKIIDSGLAREYVHPSFGYHLYYPTSWEVDAVDTTSQEILISAITGDFISVHSFQKEGEESFESWFARVASEQRYSDLVPFSNRFLVSGWKRKDGLVGYFSTPQFFLVAVYHPGGSQTILYPRVMEMLLQSVRLRTTLEVLPDQPLVPGITSINSTTPSSTAL